MSSWLIRTVFTARPSSEPPRRPPGSERVPAQGCASVRRMSCSCRCPEGGPPCRRRCPEPPRGRPWTTRPMAAEAGWPFSYSGRRARRPFVARDSPDPFWAPSSHPGSACRPRKPSEPSWLPGSLPPHAGPWSSPESSPSASIASSAPPPWAASRLPCPGGRSRHRAR